jgi:DNA-binding TFAR19-related protein (PDSD5 family)
MLYFLTFSESLVELGGMDAAIKTFLEANTKERAATVEVVRMLIPIMDQQLYLNAGYSSLFAFLTEKCRYSEASAYRRMAAAKVVKLREESLKLLEAGKLTLCSMAEMSKIMTDQNADSLLAKVQGLSKRETKALVAKQLPPVAVKHERVRKVNMAPVAAPLLPPVAAVASSPLFTQLAESVAPASSPVVQPEATVMTSYAFLADEEFDELLAEVKTYAGNQPLAETLNQP